MRVLVLGGGVIGLTTALRLIESGADVTVRAAMSWEDTASAVAAAIWYPFRAYPADRVRAWSTRSFEVFADLAGSPATGVRMVPGRVLWRTDRPPLDDLPTTERALAPSELPPGYDQGVRATVPIIEMPLYLAWLRGRVERLGGRMEIATVRSLDDALATYPVVVNCTGMGARELVPDPAMIPIRGQVVRVENPGLSGFTVDAGDHGDDISYVIPRSRDVVLGGTAIAGSASVTPDPDAARRIIERCTALEPALRDAAVIAHAAGIRPGRSAVRVEAESRGGGVAVHNYGHGGSGVTISWGCAEEAALLALTRAPASS